MAQTPTPTETVTKEECRAQVEAVAGAVAQDCYMVLQQAEAYMQQQQIQIDSLTQINTYNEDIIAQKTMLLENMRAEQDKWYNKPIYVGILSFLAGGLTLAIIER